MAASTETGVQSGPPLWARTLKHTYLHAGGSLHQPLGPWITPVDERDRQYPMLYHEYSGVIHQYDGSIYRQLPVMISKTRRVLQATLETLAHSLHTPGQPGSILKSQDTLLTARYTPPNQCLNPTSTTFHPRFRHLPTWAADLLQHLDICEEHLPLLAQSNRMVVSDGGVKDGKGYFGVIIAVGATFIT